MATKEGDVEVIREGLTFNALLHDRGTASVRRRRMGDPRRGHPELQGGRQRLRAARRRVPEDLVAERHEHRRAEVLPRHPRHAAARIERPPAHRPGRRHDPRLGREATATSPPKHDAQVFADELTHLIVTQKAAFNSPVWFNVGRARHAAAVSARASSSPSTTTCRSILNWYVEEGTIFKGGSGSGINLSQIRSSKESLAGGGTASGPVCFMRGADASAGTIKSGGKTRRAAKMVILNIDHPTSVTSSGARPTRSTRLARCATPGSTWTSTARTAHSIQYQNANNSVRVTDEFMRAFEQDQDWKLKAVTSDETVETVRARELMREIADAAWQCADPGMQYDTTINEWHTCPASGRINASNPCSRVHAPGQLRVQPGVAQPHEVPGRGRQLRRRQRSSGRSRSCSPPRRSSWASPTTRPRRSRRTRGPTVSWASATRTSARC